MNSTHAVNSTFARPRTVLVADDDDRVREGIVSLLLSEGLRAIAVDTGLDAVRAIAAMLGLDGDVSRWNPGPQQNPRDSNLPTSGGLDFLVVDYNLPDLTGVEIIARMKTELRINLPAIVVSGETDNDLERRVHQVGGFALVPKPVEPAVFRRRVRELISTEL